MSRAANRSKQLWPRASPAPRLPAAPKAVRIGRPANDNLPPWFLRAGRAIVIGGVALAGLVIVALVYT